MINSIGHSLCRTVAFSSDGYRLKGVLHLPGKGRPPVVVGSHGLLSSSASPKQMALAHQCNAAGMAYFRFDHRGCGASQGRFTEVTSLAARVQDLVDAVRAVRARADTGAPIGLFGSSMGGAVCLAAAGRVGAEVLVTFAAPCRSRSIRFADSKSSDLSESLERQLQFDIADTVEGVRNVLVFHGDADEVVPFSEATEIFERLATPRRLFRQKGGDHLMSDAVHQATFTREAVRWLAAGLKS